MAENSSEYVMGHDDRERRRLSLQASIINPLTEQLLQRAGLAPGMRVLDIGCGVGEVSMMAARLIGRSGRVTGIDIDEGALAMAAARAKEERLPIEFEHASISTFRPDGSFDAVIGRHILIHMPDPGEVLRLARSFLHTGGVAVFHEYDFSVVHRAFPPAPVYDRAFEIFREFFGAMTHGNIGTRLFHLFSEAGFSSPQCVAESPMDGGADSPFYDWIAESLRSIMPRAAAAGVMRPEEVSGIDSLVTRLKEEAVAQKGCVIGPAMVGCFARKR